ADNHKARCDADARLEGRVGFQSANSSDQLQPRTHCPFCVVFVCGAAFARGRDFSAWIGLVPKQMSTGDRTILGRISKRGNGYLRTLFMQAARVILLRPASWPKHGFGVWLARAAQRLHPNVLAAALANKLARI